MQDQSCLIWVFLAGTQKSYCTLVFLHQQPQIFSNKISPKNKSSQIWDESCLNFGLEFQKISNLKSVFSISNLLTCKVSSKNKKCLNLGPKIPYLGVFGLQFNKNKFLISTLEFVKLLKFHPKRKKINLEPKILYLGLWL